MRQRRGGAGPKGQPQPEGKRTRANGAAARAPPSDWQAPPELILGTILERLLAMEDGNRWVRFASHVCSFWRSTAQEVLLADTAISKPPLEDFRAISVQPVLLAAKAGKEDTVTTQAAVVMEATASTGMEACSKQRFDAPPAAVGGNASGRPGSHCGMRIRSVTQGNMRARLLQQQATVSVADAAGAAKATAHEQGTPPPAAASPNHQQRQAAPVAGSIQSGMAMGNAVDREATDSDSDGSTQAQVGAAKRRRRRNGARSSGRAGSVEKPQRQQQQQEPGDGEEAGPSNAAAWPHSKRMANDAAAEARPSKRQQVAQQAQLHSGAAPAIPAPLLALLRHNQWQQQQQTVLSPQVAPQALPVGITTLLMAQQQLVGGGCAPPPAVPLPVANPATLAAFRAIVQQSVQAAVQQQQQQQKEAEEEDEQPQEGNSGASGSYYEAEAGVEVEQEPQGQEPAREAEEQPRPPSQQREGSGGPMCGLVGLVKRIVGL